MVFARRVSLPVKRYSTLRFSLESVARERVVVLLDQGFVSAGNFLSSILIARLLGLEKFGVFVLAWMLVLFAASIHSAFVIQPMYTLSAKSQESETFLAKMMALNLVFISGAAVSVFGIAELAVFVWYPTISPFEPALLALASLLYLLNDYIRRIQFVLHIPSKAMLIDSSMYGVQIALLSLLNMNLDVGIDLVLWVVSGSIFTSLTMGLIFCYRSGLLWRGFREHSRAVWTFAKYLVGTALMGWASSNVLILLAGNVLGPAAIGVVRASQNIVGVVNVPLLAMENIVPVRAVEVLQRDGRQAMMDYFYRVLLATSAPIFAVLILIVCFSEELMTVAYGSSFAKSYPVLELFGLLYGVVFAVTLLRIYLRTTEQIRTIFKGQVLGALAVLPFVFPLLLSIGASGVVLGMILIQAVIATVYLNILRKDVRSV